ncbi:adenosylcobinamide-GDP ribazoletransferase [Robbsia sp. Bb-Pol-6]|uniref:Adenosylcobinamide-GDP ribazoletransferase n=1 Tax=Robbsia betulipollinis TaxID=2981849 RepID=A0ABT3ZRB0_9BURK|nr:adenosylcobinamide-GDP ribazoletransferase [Robbsia betulipollinis]MCY0389099.1 adenosylcobinamide-GDP ribazoletransferase [Robbsia betulipollinis]
MTMTDGTRVRGAYARTREEACIVLTAFGYFSRLPVPSRLAFSQARLAASGRYLPLVGLVIGSAGALIYGLALQVLPAALAVLLSMAATLLASGALHEDGLADCCDAFGGAHAREDVLRIMKDSRIGAFGAIGVVVALLVKWQALTALAQRHPLAAAGWMIAAHMASRAGAIVYVATLDYARADGKSRAFAQRSPRAAAVALLIGLPGLFGAGTRLGALCLMVGLLLHVALGRWFKRRLGGYTGDCLGLAQQVFEIAIYLVVLGWISS